MPLDRIVYKRNFQIDQFIYETVGAEGAIGDGETMEGLLSQAKSRVEDWQRSATKAAPVLHTDYFTGPDNPQQPPAIPEQTALDQIKIALNNFQTQEDAIKFVQSEFPDYVDHFIVKTIIKTKQIKKNGKGKKD